MLTVKFKKLDPNAVIPSYAHTGDAGLDLTATSKTWDEEKRLIVMGTGLAMEIPEGYVGLIFPRSSICKTPLSLSNSVGVIDSLYRGEVKFMFRPGDRPTKNYEIGDRVGQLIILPFPNIQPIEATELNATERGEGGFGSSGGISNVEKQKSQTGTGSNKARTKSLSVNSKAVKKRIK